MKSNNYIKTILQLCLTALLTLSFTTETIAQKVVPKDGKIEHKGGERPSIYVNLDPEPKPLKKAWKSYLKDNYDFKIKGIGFLSNKDLLYREDVIIQKLSTKRMDFYTKIVEDEVGSEMTVFASFGYDIYIDKNETPEEYAIMTKMLNDFLASYLPDYYESEVKETKKRVKKLSKEVKGLNKDINKNNEDIEEMTEEIEKLSKEVSEKEAALEIANTKLGERQEKLKRINSKLNSQ
ncbi:coiled-coil domain-containing protein [Brumimicrobium mesophilum]|uniref:coiled-coil domain-containing protein n=1 Tax=Brumimicrobium mesophilum TaxID=392717 RepID=UPI000D1404BB|nr:hypothetical protein [Brumimicrobium mesophilum]